MPKPLFLVRSSGLYVRFLIPADLRAVLGSRFFVRSLHGLRNDAARLAAAQVAMALSDAFKAFRGGLVSSDEFKRGIRTFTIDAIKVGQTTLSGIRVDDDNDAARFNRLMKELQDREDEENRKRNPMAFLYSQNAKKLAKEYEKKSVKLRQAADKHLQDLVDSTKDVKTITESRLSLRILCGVVGDIQAHELTADSARAFFAAVKNYPKHATQREEYKDLSVKQIVRLARKNDEPPLAQATLNKHWSRLSVFFGFLQKSGHLDRDPLAGLPKPQSTVKSDRGRPFTPDEFKVVFGPQFKDWAYKWPHRYWGVMLGLYSGARVTEVAQLRPQDIMKVNGVWGAVITDRIEGNKTKNDNSDRFVPLAQPVLDAGFLGYVEEVKAQEFERLFPNLPNGEGELSYGRQLSRQFSAYVKDNGITEAGMGFHALRHYFITYTDRALANEGMKEEARTPLIGRITGHQKALPTTLRKVYVDNSGLQVPVFFEPETIEERAQTVAKFVANVQVDYPAYVTGQFQQAFVKAQEEADHKQKRSKLKSQIAKKKEKSKNKIKI